MKTSRLRCLALALLAYPLGPFLVQAEESGLSDFAGRLTAAMTVVDQVQNGASLAHLEKLGSLLPPSEPLRFRGQQIQTNLAWVPLDVGSIYEAPTLDERLTRLNQLRARLSALREHLIHAEATAQPDRTGLRRTLDEVLRNREYRWRSNQSWLDLFWDYLRDALANVTGRLRLAPGLSRIPEWLLSGILLLIALALVAVTVRRMSGFVRARATYRRSPDRKARAIQENDWTADQYQLRAERSAREGDFRTALRWLFLAALSALRQTGQVKWRSSATNRDYLRELGARRTETFSAFAVLSGGHERCWYGREPLDADSYRNYERSARVVIEPPAGAPQ
ncbi:MAG: DUF4129 domain-containing protein [Acidobacteria bacterium]|nr:DUF4129 domain-containing protein [Acidobacteriota bacterium]